MAKTKAGYLLLGVLLAVLFLYPIVKETFREQKYGLLLSPEDVKATCGKPQIDDWSKLTYIEGDRRVELQFTGVNHRMYLKHVQWSTNKTSGDINQVSVHLINEYVGQGSLPACLNVAAR